MSDSNTDDVQSRLLRNIQDISQDASTPIDVRTFEEADLILAKVLKGDERLSVIQPLVAVLPNLQQDPTPAVNLLVRFLEDFSYSEILSFGSQSLPWTDGLAVGEHMVSYNRLMLTLLRKATARSTDAAHVANLLNIDREIRTDPDAHLPEGGQGLMWKRIFGDKNIYGTFFEACSLSGPSSLKLSKNQRTLAQARLMEWLPTVGGMDWNTISRSHHPDIEAAYGVKKGLLEFATLHMVDYKDDVLMHRCLIDFYSDLLRITKWAGAAVAAPYDSSALRYLITQGVHARTTATYLQHPGTPVDPVDSMFLYGPAANYVATYASAYSDHFLASQMPKQVNERLMKALDITPGKWAHGHSPKHDLHLVASLPRKSLLPGSDGGGAWSSYPVSLLPSRSTNPDVLNTLAAVFHGPEQKALTFPPGSPLPADGGQDQTEAVYARALYYHHVANNPKFWQDIVRHADTVALKDLALAAINCLTAVITANWSTTSELTLPTSIAAPESGQLAILSPPALEYALPYLLKPPQTFANLVGGRGDAESAAYKIASANFDALRALHSRLMTQAEQQPQEGFEEILATLSKRLAEGPLSREGEVGGRIGTLDL
ncbi:hypothetical protein LTR37_008787 [Vermiconidia calcicola]|uniref:Uncharacterized protein n=1 Tax=Vermiconidia calcicola TaxID=1690605 RepID=A0ACC3N9H0_9PEZI|nr:hypothetical protein LTR37_008787 [Vermiconidia calcicola]